MWHIEEAKSIDAKPVGDPMVQAMENFERALRERNS
jgi:hypothetical protein